jgi:hypothetical protein
LSALVAGLLLSGSALAGTDVPVNSSTNGVQNEVSLTLNPNTPGNVVVVYNDQPGSGNGIGVSFSTNSGASWTDLQLGDGLNAPLDPGTFQPFTNIFDPVSGSDTQGNVYAGYIATGSLAGSASGVYVHRSIDGGATWTGPTTVHTQSSGPTGQGLNLFRFNDKPHLEVDQNNGNAYLAWIQDDGGSPQGDLRFAYSLDSGSTWNVNSLIPNPVNDNSGFDQANGPNLTVAPNGEVFLAWIDTDVTDSSPGARPGALMLDRSSNPTAPVGAWGVDQTIATVRTLPRNLSTASGHNTQDDARSRGYPVIVADPTDLNPIDGQTLYLTYAADPDPAIAETNDEADIFFIKSTDSGASWTSPLRINDDFTLTDQFAPWMAVKPDGTIDIVWYDKRNSADDDQWDVYFSNSTDGGNSFSANVLVSDNTYATPLSSAIPPEPWLGEYLGLAVDSNFAYIGFTARGDANGDVFFDRIPNFQFEGVPEPSAGLLVLALFFLAPFRRLRSRR